MVKQNLQKLFNLKSKYFKSQISLFIIIGLILIIVTAFMFYSSKVDLFVSHDTKIKNQVSAIVKDCLYKNLNTGVFLIGQQGGFINIPKSITLNPFKYSSMGVKIPNWDVTTGNIPTINSMENQLDEYVKQNSYNCIISSLNNLSNIYSFNISKNLSVKTTINSNDVITEASLPIRFKEKNSDQELAVKDYLVSIKNVHLGDLYNLAVSIYKTEASNYFLEKLVLEQIYSDADYSSPYSMPGEGMFLSCYRRIWTYDQLKRNLANLNNNNFKFLQLIGTADKTKQIKSELSVYPDAKDMEKYYDKIYRINLIDKKPSFKNYDVKVFMPSTEINNKKGFLQRYPFRKFKVTPSDNNIVKSIQMKVMDKIPVPCIQLYNHVYTLDYDLIFRLQDINEKNGYIFQFPIRVNIEKNNPKRKLFTPFSFGTKKKTLTADKYCSNESKKYPLMIVTTDLNDNPINNVNISYKCLDLECSMGTTKKPVFMGITRKYATPQLIAKFPYCYNGFVIGQKKGYLTAKKMVKTDQSLLRRNSFVGDNLITLKLIPYKEFKIDSPENFLIIFKEDGTGYRVLNNNDGYIYIDIHNGKYNFDSYAIWPNSPDTAEFNKLKFLDIEGLKYNVTAYFSDKDYNLRGYMELKNWTPDIHAGNKIQFIIPGSKNIIDSDHFIDFYNYAKKESKLDLPKIY